VKLVCCTRHREACDRCQAHMPLEHERLDGFALQVPGVNLRLEMEPMHIFNSPSKGTWFRSLALENLQHELASSFLTLLSRTTLSVLVVCFVRRRHCYRPSHILAILFSWSYSQFFESLIPSLSLCLYISCLMHTIVQVPRNMSVFGRLLVTCSITAFSRVSRADDISEPTRS
jgi:hypothetical protein